MPALRRKPAPEMSAEHAGSAAAASSMSAMPAASVAAASSAAPPEDLRANILQLKQDTQQLNAEKVKVNKALRNAEKKRARLKRKAREFTDADVLQVLRLRGKVSPRGRRGGGGGGRERGGGGGRGGGRGGGAGEGGGSGGAGRRGGGGRGGGGDG